MRPDNSNAHHSLEIINELKGITTSNLLASALEEMNKCLLKYGIEEAENQPLSLYLSSEDDQWIKLNLMHNHNGFAKEIRHLKMNLEEQHNEKVFLENDIERLNSELQQISPLNKINSDHFDLNSEVIQLNNGINTRRQKLKQLVIDNIKMNERIYELFKEFKILEVKLLKSNSDQLDAEKKFYVDKLKQTLSELSIRKEKNHKETINELESILNQKERLQVALHTLLIDLNEKIDFINLQSYSKIYYEYETPCKSLQLTRVHRSEQNLFQSLDYYPTSSYVDRTLSKVKMQYYIIVPSPIELK